MYTYTLRILISLLLDYGQISNKHYILMCAAYTRAALTLIGG